MITFTTAAFVLILFAAFVVGVIVGVWGIFAIK